MDHLLSRNEVAEWLGIPYHTLAAWASQGTGPRYFRVGKHARYRREDVQAWLEEQAVPVASREDGAPT